MSAKEETLLPSVVEEPPAPTRDPSLLAIRISLFANFGLLLVKCLAVSLTGSLALFASLLDSLVDCISQLFLFTTSLLAAGHLASSKEKYPVGMTKVECLGILSLALIMGASSMLVIQEAWEDLYYGFHDSDAHETHMTGHLRPNLWVALFLGVSALLKYGLYRYCARVYEETSNKAVEALMQDHFNDVFTITGANAFAGLAAINENLWVVDPIGATLIALYIIRVWGGTVWEQVNMLIGKSASPEFYEEVAQICQNHNEDLWLDQTTIYHFGPRYYIEVEAIMPPDTPLRVAHDVGMELQHKLEANEQVERAFVHLDYQSRAYDEHDRQTWPASYLEHVLKVTRRQNY